MNVDVLKYVSSLNSFYLTLSLSLSLGKGGWHLQNFIDKPSFMAEKYRGYIPK